MSAEVANVAAAVVVVSAPVLKEPDREVRMCQTLINQRLAEHVELGNLIDAKFESSLDENLSDEQRRELRRQCYALNSKRKTAKIEAEILMIELQKGMPPR